MNAANNSPSRTCSANTTTATPNSVPFNDNAKEVTSNNSLKFHGIRSIIKVSPCDTQFRLLETEYSKRYDEVTKKSLPF